MEPQIAAAEPAVSTAAAETAAVVSGMDTSTVSILAILVAGATFLLHVFTNVIGGTWKLKDEIGKKIETERAALANDILSLQRKIDVERNDFGQVLIAMRQKINDVELQAAQVYVRRDTWHQSMEQLHSQLQATDKASEERSLRLETKLDRISDRLSGRPS